MLNIVHGNMVIISINFIEKYYCKLSVANYNCEKIRYHMLQRVENFFPGNAFASPCNEQSMIKNAKLLARSVIAWL